MKNLIVVALFLFLINSAFAQEKIFEDLLESFSEQSDQSELVENLERLQENPININVATKEQLALIPFLSPQQQLRIIQHRKENGPYKFKTDLLKLNIINQELFEAIEQFIAVELSQKPKLDNMEVNFRTRISRPLMKPVGYENGTYDASVNKVYNRMQFKLGENLSGGLLTEKDAGEKRLNDLTLFYLELQASKNTKLIAGNYQLQLGQGISFWGPYGYAKGTNTIYPIKKRSTGFKKYLSVDENSGLFGFAAAIQFGQVTFVPFFSQAKLDASLINQKDVSGISTSGFHRTASEQARENLQQESTLGAHIQYILHQNLRIGSTVYYSDFKKRFNNLDFARNRFDFRGKSNHVIGFNWEYTKSQFEFFGELARSKNGGRATLTGIRIYENPIKLAFLFRKYDKDYQNFHSLGFGESSDTQNETGFYSGLEYQIMKGTKISAYYDLYKFPWRSYFEPLPRSGNDMLTQLQHKLSKSTLLIIRYKQKSRQPSQNYTDTFGRTKKESIEQLQKQYRAQVDFRGIKNLLIRSRVDFTTLNKTPTSNIQNESENGILIYQDLWLQATGNLRIWARYSFFGTDSFDSRVFQYENDLPGVLTNRALFGEGTRWYLLLKYQLTNHLNLHFKFAELYRKDVDELGSGSDLIDSNIDQRFSVQLEGRF